MSEKPLGNPKIEWNHQKAEIWEAPSEMGQTHWQVYSNVFGITSIYKTVRAQMGVGD